MHLVSGECPIEGGAPGAAAPKRLWDSTLVLSGALVAVLYRGWQARWAYAA